MTKIPKSLQDAIRANKVIPFVGAGASMNIRAKGSDQPQLFPSWSGLFERAARHLRDEALEEKIRAAANIDHLLAVSPESRDYLKVADVAEKALGTQWLPFLRDVFDCDEFQSVPESLALGQAIWQVGSRLLLTTNFDRVLQWACPAKGPRIVRNGQHSSFAKLQSDEFRPRIPTIWHLHGHIDDENSIILSRKKFDELYDSIDLADTKLGISGQISALNTLTNLVISRSFLFIGFSLEDPYFRHLMKWIQRAYGGATATHYILIRERDQPRLRELLSEFHPLPVEAVPFADFGEPLLKLTQALAEFAPPPPPPSALLAPEAQMNVPIASAGSDSSAPRSTLTAGQYARTQQAARMAVDKLAILAKQLRLPSIDERVAELHEALSEELYKVAITGKSRAGKSTLLNALMGRTLFPSQNVRTTAVPIIVGPGVIESATVHLQKGNPIPLVAPLSVELLAPYADQQQNPGNQRGIEYISIRLTNEFLDIGVEYMDIPGFDDPDKGIHDTATGYIKYAHALIVVMDVSSYATGGFTIDRNLAVLLTHAHKSEKRQILLVCNKADVLTQTQQNEVERYIRSDLKQLGFSGGESVPIFCLSAQEAARQVTQGKESPLAYRRFQEALWAKLWTTESIGLRRLYRIFDRLRVASEEASVLIAARRMKESDRLLLREALDLCQQKKQNLLHQCKEDCNDQRQHIIEHIEQIQRDLRSMAEASIARQAISGQLPKKTLLLKDLQKPLDGYLRTLFHETMEWTQKRVSSGEASISESLSALRAAAALPTTTRQLHVDLSELLGRRAEIEMPSTQNWEHLLLLGGSGVLSGVAATALAGLVFAGGIPFAIGAAVFALASSVTDRLTDRADTREGLLQECERFCGDRLTKLHGQLENYLNLVEEALLKRCNSRMGSFIRDMRERLADLREPSEEEETLHRELDAQIAHALGEFQATFAASTTSQRP